MQRFAESVEVEAVFADHGRVGDSPVRALELDGLVAN